MQATGPFVSLITTCHGQLGQLRQSLPMMIGQPDCELVVVDFECPDGTASWVEATYPGVRIQKVRGASRYLVSTARNRGVEAARGEWLILLDADVVLRPGFVTQLAPRLRPGLYGLPTISADEVTTMIVCSRSDFLQVGGYDEALLTRADQDRDLFHRLSRTLGRRVMRFPAEWLQALDTSVVGAPPAQQAARVLDEWTDEVYVQAKYDLLRLAGTNHFPAVVRQRLHASVRRQLMDAVSRQATSVMVTVETPMARLNPSRGHGSFTRKLVYGVDVPVEVANDARTAVDAGSVVTSKLPGKYAPSTSGFRSGRTGMSAEFRYLMCPELTPGPTLFAIVKNEAYLLPHFVAHYRGLGIENFIFYDDHSVDGSQEWMCSQPNCTVLTSDLGYRETMPDGAEFSLFAKRQAHNLLREGQWLLTVDADEFLVLPPRFAHLAELYDHLDERGHRCVLASMVDFYPENLAKRNYPAATSPFVGSPYFDTDRTFERLPSTHRPRMLFKGIRARLLDLLKLHDPNGYARLARELNYKLAVTWKVPLIRTGCGVALETVHTANVQPPFDIELALAHFKFGPDLDDRIAGALLSRNYFRGSIEYEFLKAAVDKMPHVPLTCPNTMAFEGPHSLEKAGLSFVARPGSAAFDEVMDVDA